ncbi:MAG TPA: ABC transporter permease [Casimicrobiaceae bacterium]|nr:ABC transporter permease [Casimicrobiaceae bacterium]
MLRYAASELIFRSGRSLVTAVSIAVAVLAAIVLTALATSYARALRVPLDTVGADVIVQQQGDIPPKLEGLVFPHPNALVPANVVAQIRAIPGVIALTRAVYMWDLEADRYESVLGIEDSDVGLAGLAQRLVDGKPIDAASRAVVIDSDYAAKNKVNVGDNIKVGVDEFPVAGIVDAARSGKLVRADVYMPLSVAQGLATAAPQVRALYPFGADDANLVLVKVNREQLEAVVDKITALVGKKGVVSSELSMRQALSGVLFLSQSMGLIIAGIIGLFAAAFVWRATATAVAERRREMAILQAIGWSWRHIGEQVLIENVALAVIGTVVGLVVALAVVLALGHVSVTVDLPWDLSSTPHFIPAATINRSQTISAPLSVSWLTAAVAIAGSLIISLLAVLAVLALPRPQPWSLLHAE